MNLYLAVIGCKRNRGRADRGQAFVVTALPVLDLLCFLLEPNANPPILAQPPTLEAEQQALEALGWSYSLEQLRKAEVIRL